MIYLQTEREPGPREAFASSLAMLIVRLKHGATRGWNAPLGWNLSAGQEVTS